MRRLQPTRLSHLTMSVPCPELSGGAQTLLVTYSRIF